MNKYSIFRLFFIMIGLFLTLIPNASSATITQVQIMALHQGWNAVFLEVEPISNDLDGLFAGLPIDSVATYYPNRTPVDFIQDPNEPVWKQPGWHKWIPPTAPDAFLKNLYGLQAGQAYLIHATEAFEWNLEGKMVGQRPVWQPNSYNLVGFFVTSDNVRTFQQFFSASRAHQDGLIYTLLDDGSWQKVDPLVTLVERGRAYWVFCRGNSDFVGPLDVQLPSGNNTLNFLFSNKTIEFSIHNASNQPSNVTMETPIEGVDLQQAPISLKVLDRASGVLLYEGGIMVQPLPLQANQLLDIQVTVHRNFIPVQIMDVLINLRDDLGSRFLMSVYAENPFGSP